MGVSAVPRENDWRRNSLSRYFLLPVLIVITLKGQGLQGHASFGYSSKKPHQRDYEIEWSRQLLDHYW